MMLKITRIIIVVFILILNTYFLGFYIGKRDNRKSVFNIKNMLFGIQIRLAVFQVIAFMMIICGFSLDDLIIIYMGTIIMLLLGSIVYNNVIVQMKSELSNFKMPKNMKLNILIGYVIIFLLISFQIYLYFKYPRTSLDDASYVVTAVSAVDTNSLFKYDVYTGLELEKVIAKRVISTYPILIAYCAKLLNIHPAQVFHGIVPAIAIAICYLIYFLVAQELFYKAKERIIFLVFVNIMNIFGGYNIYTNSRSFILRVWQGKSLVANLMIPLIFYIMIRIYINKEEKDNFELLFFVNLVGVMLSTTGLVLNIYLIIILSIILTYKYRDIKIIIRSLFSCTPNFVFGVLYLVMR